MREASWSFPAFDARHGMMKPGLKSRSSRRHKKNVVPLSKLRASEVVRAVVNHPRRLGELVTLLQDKDRAVRGRAAAMLARLSDSHSARLVRHLERLSAALGDDSAYVRWHLLYALGQVGARFPGQASPFLAGVGARLTDEDCLVRRFACRALEMVAARKPLIVKAMFAESKRDIPPALARILEGAGPLENGADNG